MWIINKIVCFIYKLSVIPKILARIIWQIDNKVEYSEHKTNSVIRAWIK
jgi:hypothetical protein